MEDGTKNEDTKIEVSDHSHTIEVPDVQDGELQETNTAEQRVDGKCGMKSMTMQATSEGNEEVSQSVVSYSLPTMVESDLSSSVCPIEPMEQSSNSIPRFSMAPVSDAPQSTTQSESDHDINQAWFTTKEDKDNLQGKGAKWRQGMWSKEESEILQNNIVQYCKSRGISDPHDVVFKQSKEERKTFYRTIAKGIHRPLFAIYRRVLRTYDSGNYNGKYSPEEVTKLKEMRRKHGNDWTAIGLALGRSASSVKDRCRLLNEKCSSGKWTQDEESRLSQAVHEMTSTVPGESVTTGILWTDVARRLGTRSEKQCRSKWLNYLNWKECGGKEWNKTDEIDLIKKIYNLGVQSESDIDWATLANGWASARSPQWLRSKWWAIKKHVPQALSFPDTILYLHSHYARSLKHRLDRHDSRYLPIPTAEQHSPLTLSTTGAPVSPLTTCTTVSTTVGHAITVDGEIYLARGDGKGSDGMNTYEMVHLRPLPNTDPSQPTSYIIEPVQCSVTGSAASYILHQASAEQGVKLVKLGPGSGVTRQGIQTHADASTQQSNAQENNILTQSVIVSPLPSNDETVALGSESSPKHIEDTVEMVSRAEASLPDGVQDSYVNKSATDILQDQQLECASEEEISTTVHEESESIAELRNSKTAVHNNSGHKQSHDALAYDNRPEVPTSHTVTQSLDTNFPSPDNAVYSQSLVPSLVSSTRPAQIITNEVIISQPTLPEHILQAQGDEPAFLTNSTIVVPSPMGIVNSAMGDETVASDVNGIPSESLVIENDMTYFK